MTATTEEKYKLLVEQARALIEGEDDWIANTANLSALLFNSLNDVNFAGVYRYENDELILGPFQGMPACVHIQMGKVFVVRLHKQKQRRLLRMYMNLLVTLLVIVLQIRKSLYQFLIRENFGASLILIRPS